MYILTTGPIQLEHNKIIMEKLVIFGSALKIEIMIGRIKPNGSL